jgi:cupin fold WbuC family metalloprotein
MLHFYEEDPAVLYATDPVPVVGDAEIAFLKERAAAHPLLRCRLCLHADPASPAHEMVIVHHRDAYVRPHRHPAKSETLVALEGEAEACTFDDAGAVRSSWTLRPPGTGAPFTYFMPAGTWHALTIRSEWFVFVETTTGPFERAGTEFPVWAPARDAASA